MNTQSAYGVAMSAPPARPSISVVVPTLNEVENIEPLVRRIIQSTPACEEIIIVDDGSQDGTPAAVRAQAATAPVRLIERVQPRLGLSGAVLEGARVAHGEILVVMDADLSHPAEDIPNLLAPILDGRADMVIGSRYVRGGTTPGWPVYRRIMSRLAAGIAYPLTGVHDSMCGFFAIRRPLLIELAPSATGFKIAFETIARGRDNLRVIEVPIAFCDRARGASKMNWRVALLFSLRWCAAASRVILRRRH